MRWSFAYTLGFFARKRVASIASLNSLNDN